MQSSQSTFNLDDTFREYDWNYFELHADQRLKAFQFFISLSTALVGGFLLLFRFGQGHKWAAVLGLLLALFSFVFWKLDRRTRMLVHNAEEALKYLDALHNLPDVDGAPWRGYFSYSRCFKYVFVTFAILGVVGAVACIVWLPV